MSLWLSPEELYDLTGYKLPSKQVETLANMRPPVRFRIRPTDSFPLVDRAQFLDGSKPGRRREPNFAAVGR